MMNALARLFAMLLAAIALAAAPAHAQVTTIETWVEQWDPATETWVRVADGADRFVDSRAPDRAKPIARYGAFEVLSDTEAALVDATDSRSPGHFAALLRDYPRIATLRMIEAPGTAHDGGNLTVGRMIRAAGIGTHVPRGGSVRSGGVELFLAGATRRIDDGAEFAVHSWLDTAGREAGDYAIDAPQHRVYLDYYRDMGMSPARARAFYDMTNSVPYASAKWLTAQDMRVWLEPEAPPAAAPAEPRIAYLDLTVTLP